MSIEMGNTESSSLDLAKAKESEVASSDATAVATGTAPSIPDTGTEAHKTASAPKSILKESRIAVAESKTQSQINKWIKGDPAAARKPAVTETVATVTTQAVQEKPSELPAPVSVPKAEQPAPPTSALTLEASEKKPDPQDIIVADELPPIMLPQRDVSANGSRKRTAAKSVLKPGNEPPAKQAKAAEVKSPKQAKEAKTTARGTTPKKRGKTSSRKSIGAPEVWSGEPDDNLGEGFEWSKGWIKKKFERQSGKTKGALDSYWYSPILQKKLRSLAEVKRFIRELKANGGDEEEAWRKLH